MHIRTITAGAREADVERVARAAQRARTRLEEAGYTVQTLRLALASSGSNTCADFTTVAQGAERLALDAGFDYVSIGQVEADRLPHLAEALAATETVFASANIAGPDGALRYESIRRAAETIVKLGATTPQGFGNLRFAASACVAPGSPFFPAAYHDGGEPWIAVGPEAASLANQVIGDWRLEIAEQSTTESPVSNLQSPILERVTKLIETHDQRIDQAVLDVAVEAGVRFTGCDWSFAPHPDPARSIGAAIEALSGVPFGAWGTLAAIRGLTSAVRAARARQLGFSGVMLPVLEDATLAQRNSEGRYTLRDLLAFSAVCGTGLDTIPLPGNTTPEQIANVLLEVAALAATLRKPLTARLMPIPGLSAGEMTTFDFPYFVNTRVMTL
jgi:hypothetical protein